MADGVEITPTADRRTGRSWENRPRETRETHAIVGGGVAAANAAEALRGDGFDSRITIASVALRAPDFYTSDAIEPLSDGVDTDEFTAARRPWHSRHSI